MTLEDAVRAAAGEALLGSGSGYGPATLDVRADAWVASATAACDAGAVLFDLLTAYDDGDAGLAVVVHLSRADAAEHVLIRTWVPREAPSLPSITALYAGAAWHERETHEMFGVDFPGHPGLDPLLLGPDAPATPLRKDAVLVARVARPWPGEKDPADSAGRGRRRRTLPPGVPEHWVPGPADDRGAQP